MFLYYNFDYIFFISFFYPPQCKRVIRRNAQSFTIDSVSQHLQHRLIWHPAAPPLLPQPLHPRRGSPLASCTLLVLPLSLNPCCRNSHRQPNTSRALMPLPLPLPVHAHRRIMEHKLHLLTSRHPWKRVDRHRQQP